MDFVETTQVLGNLGEFFGAIAVFATLAYLAVQIRQNTKAQRSAAYDSSIRNFIAIRQAVFENSEVSTISMKGLNDPDSLDELEWYRFRLFMYATMLSYWHVYAEPADLEEDLWETQLPAVTRVIASPGGRAYWEAHESEFVPSFRNEIQRILVANPVTRFPGRVLQK